MTNVSQLQNDRSMVLRAVYNHAAGNLLTWAHLAKIVEMTNLAEDRVMKALLYLKEVGMVEFRANGPTVGITAYGIDTVEDEAKEDQTSKAANDVLEVIDVTELRRAEPIIEKLRQILEVSELDDHTLQVVFVDIDTAVLQMKSPEPSRHIARAIWDRVEAFLIGAGASWASQYIPRL